MRKPYLILFHAGNYSPTCCMLGNRSDLTSVACWVISLSLSHLTSVACWIILRTSDLLQCGNLTSYCFMLGIITPHVACWVIDLTSICCMLDNLTSDLLQCGLSLQACEHLLARHTELKQRNTTNEYIMQDIKRYILRIESRSYQLGNRPTNKDEVRAKI